MDGRVLEPTSNSVMAVNDEQGGRRSERCGKEMSKRLALATRRVIKPAFAEVRKHFTAAVQFVNCVHECPRKQMRDVVYNKEYTSP